MIIVKLIQIKILINIAKIVVINTKVIMGDIINRIIIVIKIVFKTTFIIMPRIGIIT